MAEMVEFANRLRHAINCCSKENGSDTPDFILASFLTEVLDAWDRAVVAREKFYGREAGRIKAPGIVTTLTPPPNT